MGNSSPKQEGQEKLIDKGKPRKVYKHECNDPEYKGKELDQKLQDGPVESRSCTDFLCLIVFIAFWVGFFIVCVFGFKHGQPQLIATPFDYHQNHCGYDSGFEDYPLIYYSSFPDGSSDSPYGEFLCVKSCPTGNTSQVVECAPSYKGNCNQQATQKMGLICAPDTSNLEKATVAMLNQTSYAMNQLGKIGTLNTWIHDIKIVWPILLVTLIISLVVSVVNLYLVYRFVGIVIWGSIVAFTIALAVVGYVCWHLYESGEALQVGGHTITQNGSLLKTVAIILWIIAGISALIFACSFRQINRAIDIVKATTRYMRSHLQVLLVPIFFVVVGIIFFLYWIISTIYIASAGGPKPKGTFIKTPFTNILWNQVIKESLAYNIIALIWTMQFLVALSQYVLAHCACDWYFDQKKKSLVSKSFYYAFRYHLGSLAVGSFILTLVLVIRILLAILYKYLKETSDSHTNAILNVVFKCINCCMDCFTRFIQYLNESAYIMMSISGTNFCTSASEGFFLMVRNSVQFASLQYVATIIIGLGKVFICLATAFIGYLIITRSDTYSSQIYSPVMPTFFFGLIAFLMASFIMSVLSVSSHAILMCFCVDLEFTQKAGGKYISKAPKELRDDLEGYHNAPPPQKGGFKKVKKNEDD